MTEITHTQSAEPHRINAEDTDTRFMKRSLMLATYGAGFVSPNPMVGAVVVAGGRIIGEGWHRRFGEGHAEVNALAAVDEAHRHLLPEATVYVTLEPCSHYGKTPPCARLLIEKRVRRVVVGSPDPNPLVAGRGIRMLREAGIDVTEGVMREECDRLNRRFLTSQRERRPWIQLKWAQSTDGYMGIRDSHGNPHPSRYSTPLTGVRMHRERSMADAILVGTSTIISDNPSLTLRNWPGRNPLRITFDSHRIPENHPVRKDEGWLLLPAAPSLKEQMEFLFKDKGIGSLMVEGGAETLRRFIEADLYDEIRVESSPILQGEGVKAPGLPENLVRTSCEKSGGNLIEVWRR